MKNNWKTADQDFALELFKVRALNEEGNLFGISIGDKLATDETFETKEEAISYILERPWKLMFSMSAAIAENWTKTNKK